MFIQLDRSIAFAILMGLTTAVHGAPIASGSRCGPSYGQALAERHKADRAARGGDYREANTHLDLGLRTLGLSYYTRDMLDDSGMHLVLARKAQASGQLKRAAEAKREVLSGRLELCHR